MAGNDADLFAAFREDHAVLGRGLHEIAACLRGDDIEGARRAAELLDAEAGAHIAFEEAHVYPALAPLLGEAQVRQMRREHRGGLAVIRRLIELEPRATLPGAERRRLLELCQAMQDHVAECGELFGTMGRIPPEEQQALLRHLLALRKTRPSWTAWSESAGGGSGAPRSTE